MHEEVDLRALHWLGTLQNKRFSPNTLLIHLTDGLYSLLSLSSKYPPPRDVSPIPTSAYHALMKLATLDNSIQDGLATRDGLGQQINELLADTPPDTTAEAEDKVTRARRYVSLERRAIAAGTRRREELESSIAARRSAIASGYALQKRAAADVADAQQKLEQSKALLLKTKESIHGQRRRICEDLSQIYNIILVPGRGPPLSFQICGVPLPNTEYDSTLATKSAGEDELSAALGHAVLLTDCLQYYLGVPLPYPLTPLGSRSSVRDDISKLPENNRDFPLYVPRGGSKAQFKFDYAWFLLNKDVEALCASQGLKVQDIRHTLPNLKYLLYVCSAGTEELPERKRGGLRGFSLGNKAGNKPAVGPGDASSLGPASRDGSRPGSADSDARGKQTEALRHAAVLLNGAGAGAGRPRTGLWDSAAATATTAEPHGPGPRAETGSAAREPLGLSLPFDQQETTGLSLRTKGMRERSRDR